MRPYQFLRWSLLQKVPKGGFEPPTSGDSLLHERSTFTTKLQQIKTLEGTAPQALRHQDTISEHQNDVSLYEKCVTCVSHIPEDIATVVAAWDSLPAAVKAGIVAMVTVARQQ